jgi:opacity protein-like surface antigen
MKRLMITAAALALTAAAAHAADTNNGWYYSIGGGWNQTQDNSFKSGFGKSSVDYDAGWMGEVALGRAWGHNMRTEIEGSYRRNDINSVDGASGTGDFHSWGAMLNEYYDFHNSTPWMPYIGAGVGAAFEDAHHVSSAAAPGTAISGSDTEFAYQGIAGVDYWVTPRSAFGIRYDYLGTTQSRFGTGNSGAGDAKGEYQNNAILATYRFQLPE